MKYIICRNMIYYDNKQRYHITKFLHMKMKWIVFNLKLVFGNHIFFFFLDIYFYSFILFICTWVHIFFLNNYLHVITFVPLPSKLYKSIVMSTRQGASTMHNDSKQFCFIFQGLRNQQQIYRYWYFEVNFKENHLIL
jgi:hypothetical protein